MRGREPHTEKRRQMIVEILRAADTVMTCQNITDALPNTERTRYGVQEIRYGSVYQNLRELHASGVVNRIRTSSGTYWSAVLSNSDIEAFDQLVSIFGKEPSE